MRTRRRQRGFTLVEVVVSLGVMTVATMAIIALQQQIVRSNAHARQITTATQIAQNWIERLKIDALRWNIVGPPNDTTYLKEVGALDTLSGFRTIPLVSPTGAQGTRLMSNAFDFYGDELDHTAAAPPNLFYCASYRLNWVYNNQRAIRADVRVWWAREGVAVITADYPKCDEDNSSLNPPDGKHYDRYHIVYLSTVIRAAPI